ncbi:MAG TPA: hypothetical protein VF006_32890 [Longimicrobium sp.]
MSATLLNAPARPLLTRSLFLLLSLALLAVALLSVAIGGSARRQDPAARPDFTRRLVTLPAVVVTGSDGMYVVTSTSTSAR